jgi:hypothetical protein
MEPNMRHQVPRAAVIAALAVKPGRTAATRNLRTPLSTPARDFASLLLWVSGFLGGGYLLLWKPLLDRWIF